MQHLHDTLHDQNQDRCFLILHPFTGNKIDGCWSGYQADLLAAAVRVATHAKGTESPGLGSGHNRDGLGLGGRSHRSTASPITSTPPNPAAHNHSTASPPPARSLPAGRRRAARRPDAMAARGPRVA